MPVGYRRHYVGVCVCSYKVRRGCGCEKRNWSCIAFHLSSLFLTKRFLVPVCVYNPQWVLEGVALRHSFIECVCACVCELLELWIDLIADTVLCE